MKNKDYKSWRLIDLEQLVELEPNNIEAKSWCMKRQQELDEFWEKYPKQTHKVSEDHQLDKRTMDYNEAIHVARQIQQMIIIFRNVREREIKLQVDKYLEKLRKRIDYLSSIIM